MAKFVTNVSGAMLLPSLIQVTESISGNVFFLVIKAKEIKIAKEVVSCDISLVAMFNLYIVGQRMTILGMMERSDM